jgi:hypothetical protein
MHHRFATRADAEVLAELNRQLIQDEGHGNCMTGPELVARLREWLVGGYRVSIFEDASGILAYALYRESSSA